MIIHKLKIKNEYLQNLLDGKKKAEVRYNDRDYQVGDLLEFESIYRFRITHVLPLQTLDIDGNYVVLSIEMTVND